MDYRNDEPYRIEIITFLMVLSELDRIFKLHGHYFFWFLACFMFVVSGFVCIEALEPKILSVSVDFWLQYFTARYNWMLMSHSPERNNYRVSWNSWNNVRNKIWLNWMSHASRNKWILYNFVRSDILPLQKQDRGQSCCCVQTHFHVIQYRVKQNCGRVKMIWTVRKCLVQTVINLKLWIDLKCHKNNAQLQNKMRSRERKRERNKAKKHLKNAAIRLTCVCKTSKFKFMLSQFNHFCTLDTMLKHDSVSILLLAICSAKTMALSNWISSSAALKSRALCAIIKTSAEKRGEFAVLISNANWIEPVHVLVRSLSQKLFYLNFDAVTRWSMHNVSVTCDRI